VVEHGRSARTNDGDGRFVKQGDGGKATPPQGCSCRRRWTQQPRSDRGAVRSKALDFEESEMSEGTLAGGRRAQRMLRHSPVLVPAVIAAATLVTWIVTVERMQGMDAGPGTNLGGLGWFVGVWQR
jgi:hypothetical protein